MSWTRDYCFIPLLVSSAMGSRARALAGAAALLGACRGGCVSDRDDVHRVWEHRLALLPPETRIVASVDVAKVRASAFWAGISKIVEESARDDRRIIADLAARTGWDPLRHVDRILVGFPGDARRSRQWSLAVEGRGVDEKRLVAFVRDQAAVRGHKIAERRRGGRTLWAGVGGGQVSGFFAGPGTFVLGGGGWGERMAALADRPATSVALGGELARLCGRIDPARSLWLAAIVPEDLRRELLTDPRADSAASVTRLAVSADFASGLRAELFADLSNAEDARRLAERVHASLREAKRNAKTLMLGLLPYADALTVRPDGPTLRASLSLPESQVNDLLGRLAGMARLARERRQR